MRRWLGEVCAQCCAQVGHQLSGDVNLRTGGAWRWHSACAAWQGGRGSAGARWTSRVLRVDEGAAGVRTAVAWGGAPLPSLASGGRRGKEATQNPTAAVFSAAKSSHRCKARDQADEPSSVAAAGSEGRQRREGSAQILTQEAKKRRPSIRSEVATPDTTSMCSIQIRQWWRRTAVAPPWSCATARTEGARVDARSCAGGRRGTTRALQRLLERLEPRGSTSGRADRCKAVCGSPAGEIGYYRTPNKWFLPNRIHNIGFS